MIYTKKIQKAIKFAAKTHNYYQQQMRKGKQIPYITHPLSVGLILSLAGSSDEVISAGILHDTIEDSVPEKKVTVEMLTERFGENVAQLVLSVTEQDKELPWEERKQLALEHIQHFSHESLLVKSADVISNASEMVDDHGRYGDEIFSRFNASKEQTIKNQLNVMRMIIESWPESPLASDLSLLAGELQRINGPDFISSQPARIIKFREYDENMDLECPICGWKGTPRTSGCINTDSHFALDVSCPVCDKMLLVASYPCVGENS